MPLKFILSVQSVQQSSQDRVIFSLSIAQKLLPMSNCVIILISITDLTADIFTATFFFFPLPRFKGCVISEAVFHWSDVKAFFIMTHMLSIWHERKLQHSVFLSGCVFLIPCFVCCATYYGNLSQTVLASLQGSKYSLNSRLLLLSLFLCILYVYTLKMGVPVKSHIAEWNNGRESSRLFNFVWKRQTHFRSQAWFYLLNLSEPMENTCTNAFSNRAYDVLCQLLF